MEKVNVSRHILSFLSSTLTLCEHGMYWLGSRSKEIHTYQNAKPTTYVSVYVSRSHASLHFSGYFSVPHSRKEMYDFVCKWKEMLPLFYCLYINLKSIILAISSFQDDACIPERTARSIEKHAAHKHVSFFKLLWSETFERQNFLMQFMYSRSYHKHSLSGDAQTNP